MSSGMLWLSVTASVGLSVPVPTWQRPHHAGASSLSRGCTWHTRNRKGEEGFSLQHRQKAELKLTYKDLPGNEGWYFCETTAVENFRPTGSSEDLRVKSKEVLQPEAGRWHLRGPLRPG